MIENQSWFNLGEHKTCEMKNIELNEKDFTISPKTDETIGALNLCYNDKKVFFLPFKVHESFQSLNIYRAQDCSIAKIEKAHFENLIELKALLLKGNEIELLHRDVFEDLKVLEILALGK